MQKKFDRSLIEQYVRFFFTKILGDALFCGYNILIEGVFVT